MKKVIFACVHNAGRSQMAAAFFNDTVDATKAHATSAGTQPGDQVHPEVVETMAEVGLDLVGVRPQRLTAELARGAAVLVTMGCGEDCPHVPDAVREDWPLKDPKGLLLQEVRVVRDDVRRRVEDLVQREGWQRADGPSLRPPASTSPETEPRS